jgi:uncharacterized damage-inducible protein DinB
MKSDPIRDLLARALGWQDAHVGFEDAVAGIPLELRGKQPDHLPYSVWQLVEHLRITQRDILDFCRDPEYKERKWPDEYWPSSAGPATDAAWNDSLRRVIEDREALQQLARDTSVDVNATIPHGSGQTILRELVLVVDHTAYHVGQIVLVRRLLGIWH